MAPPALLVIRLPALETEATGLPVPGIDNVNSSLVGLFMDVVPLMEGVLLIERPIPALFIADPVVVPAISGLPVPDLFMKSSFKDERPCWREQGELRVTTQKPAGGAVYGQ